MEDYSNLSKEELINMLLNKGAGENAKKKCIFVPLRGNVKNCENEQEHPWGFCKKHAKTVQATKAFEEYTRNKVKEEQEQKRSAPPEPASRTVQEPVAAKPQRRKKPSQKQRQFVVVKNKWGNYVHEKTSIVVDYDSKKAVGIQASSGQILPLTADKIKLCEYYGVSYVVAEETSDEDLSEYYDEESEVEDESDESDEDDGDESESESDSESSDEGTDLDLNEDEYSEEYDDDEDDDDEDYDY